MLEERMSALGHKRTCAMHLAMSALGQKRTFKTGTTRSSRNAIAAMLNMRGRGRFTDSDLVYWLARRSRTTIQIKVAIISMPPRADASAQ
jgi:hypothetical protein